MTDRRKKNKKSKKDAMLEALTLTMGIVSTACAKVGISRQTHYDYMDSDPEYAKAVDDINERTIDMVESKLYKKINKDECTTSTIFFLKTKAKHRGYIERQENINFTEQPLFPDTEE